VDVAGIHSRDFASFAVVNCFYLGGIKEEAKSIFTTERFATLSSRRKDGGKSKEVHGVKIERYVCPVFFISLRYIQEIEI
jgi:hypothetical protein